MKTKRNHNEGSAALIVMAVLSMVMLMGAGLLSYAAQHVYAIDRSRDSVKARAIAEAGVNHAYNVLKADFSKANDASAFPLTSLGDGTFDASVVAVGMDKATITAVGIYDGTEETVVVDVKNFADATPGSDPTDAFSYGLFINGDLTHNGASTVIGALHCNNTVTLNGKATWGAPFTGQSVGQWKVGSGGQTYVDGTVTAPSIYGGAAIATPVVAAVDVIPFPVIDMTDYYNTALANGMVFAGGTIDGDFGVIPGGVRWYIGDVTIDDIDYEGTVIATGDITVQGSVDNTRVGMLPALMSRDGYIRFNGSRDLTGLLYCPGELRFNGAGTLEGTAMTGDDLTFNGNSGVFTYIYSAPGDAGDDPVNPEDQVGITAWQK